MKAYRFDSVEGGLQLQDIVKPSPSAGQVQIKVEVCGLCHSDCHIINGQTTQIQRPLTLGHEAAGVVTELGEGVSNFKIGDRVVIGLGGHPTRPDKVIGLSCDGAYAEYAVSPARMVVPIPGSLSWEQAAVATDSVVTAYHAVVAEGKVNRSMKVAVIGLGGLGSIGLQIAILQGAEVYAFDIDTKKVEMARTSGAKGCFRTLDEAEDVKFDVILDFVGMTVTMAAALNAIVYGGRIVMIGLNEPTVTLSTFGMACNNVEIRAALGGSLKELSVVLDLLDKGKIVATVEEVPFDKLSEGLHRLETGKVVGRLFTRPNRS
ncbi:uncharacterized protein N7482_000022 [Penicillium canariense]|uniref:Enoyl reductase (ER) domain-containing protein n=1 Tax=Penicillium canariense TaxID=189055 RepID=A0A9W9IDM3_9EURO|nr:uncharacterized protein N7482_000022 [Penicillium canariense]KAJ5174145.1 hypothetical protein N7482_000022 [Penicillium canariense]